MPSDSESTFVPYGRQSLSEEEIRAAAQVLRDDWITQGPRVEAFEQALCRTTGAGHAIAVSHGTAALHLAYAAIGLGPGDEIVTSPNTFLATASCAVHLGARPVFADVESERHTLDPTEVERHFTPRTRAVVAVDFAGHPADTDALREIADRRGLRLIADAAHSLGASYRGRKVGTLADLTCLSFHPVKSVTTGEGGAVLTDDPELARACRSLRSHGMTREPSVIAEHGPWYYEVETPGWNYRITDFQCAIGIEQLDRLPEFCRRRHAVAERYAARWQNHDGLRIPRTAEGVSSAWHLYVIRVPRSIRRAVFEGLRAEGIGVQVHYVPLYRQPFLRRLGGGTPEAFPRTEAYYAEAISLPIFPDLRPAAQDRVIAAVERQLARHHAESRTP